MLKCIEKNGSFNLVFVVYTSVSGFPFHLLVVWYHHKMYRLSNLQQSLIDRLEIQRSQNVFLTMKEYQPTTEKDLKEHANNVFH